MQALRHRKIDPEADLLGYIMSCGTTAKGDPDVNGRIYLCDLGRNLLQELRHAAPQVLGAEMLGRFGESALLSALKPAEMHGAAALAVVLICATALPGFCSHLERKSPPEMFKQTMQFVAQNLHIMIVGARADGSPPEAQDCSDVAYPTLEDFIWDVRFRYFSRWDPMGAFRAAAGLPPVNYTVPADGVAFVAPDWSLVERDVAMEARWSPEGATR